VPEPLVDTVITFDPGGGEPQKPFVINSALLNPVIPFVVGYVPPSSRLIQSTTIPFAKFKVKRPSTPLAVKLLQIVVLLYDVISELANILFVGPLHAGT
jgi:hypothetical protein